MKNNFTRIAKKAMNKQGRSKNQSPLSLSTSSVYTQEWYEGFKNASSKSAEVLLRHFFSFYRPTSMIDIGAGLGLFLTAAKDSGVKELLGVEGDWVRGLHNPSIEYIYHDLEQPFSIAKTYDTAICLEVAEHLSPERGETFIDDICKVSSVIIFGAAMPFQGGNQHLNEQDPSYWIEIFAKHDYECIDLFRAKLWEEPLAMPWHAQNTFLYVKQNDPRRGLFFSQPLYNVYHPQYMLNPDVVKRYNIIYENAIGVRMALRALIFRAKQIATKMLSR